MVHKCAYLVSVHNIPLELVVNTNQTQIHLIPTCDSITWGHKTKRIEIHRQDDKQIIIVIIFFAASNKQFHFQAISKGQLTEVYQSQKERNMIVNTQDEIEFQP